MSRTNLSLSHVCRRRSNRIFACLVLTVAGMTGCSKETASVDAARPSTTADSNGLPAGEAEASEALAAIPDEPTPQLSPEEIELNKLNDFTGQLLNWKDPESVFELAHPDSQVVLADPYQRQMLLKLYTNFLVDQQSKKSELIEIQETWYPFDSGKFESPIRPTHMLICIPPTAQVSPKFESNAYWLLAKSGDDWKVVFPRHTADHIAELKRDEVASSSVEGKSESELDELARQVAADLNPELRNSVIEWVANDKLLKAYFNLKNETGYERAMLDKIMAAILAPKPAENGEAATTEGEPTNESTDKSGDNP